MEKYQSTDRHKFILYSAKLGEQTPQMARRAAREPKRMALRPSVS
jgi:hypothetical protein